jgi:hypothetical protein
MSAPKKIQYEYKVIKYQIHLDTSSMRDYARLFEEEMNELGKQGFRYVGTLEQTSAFGFNSAAVFEKQK